MHGAVAAITSATCCNVQCHFTEMCSGSEEGSYLRLIDSCITQRKAQGTCNESKEEERERSRGACTARSPPSPPPPDEDSLALSDTNVYEP